MKVNKIEQQREHFNSIATDYYKARTGPKQKLLHTLIYRTLFDGIFSNYHEDKICVLEAMCGFGEGYDILHQFIDSDIEYEGFDYSDEIVAIANAQNSNRNIYVQDITTFNADKEYDIIVLIGGLHHVPDYVDISLKNLVSCLKTEGLFINVEPTYNNWILKLACERIYRKNKVFDQDTERRFSLTELNKYYEKANLKKVKQIYPGLLAYLLWYNPDVFPILNKVSYRLVNVVWKMDKVLMQSWYGKKMSVATFSVLKKE